MLRRPAMLVWAIALIATPGFAVELTPKDSPLKLDLYGVIIANTYWNSSAVIGSDVPLWTVPGSDPKSDDTEFGIVARQSRFGFKVKAPDVGKAKLSGVLELDLFGSFPNSGQKASFAQGRLRLAYLKLDWNSFSMTAGQDWTILAPLNPTTIAHFAVTGLASSGNIWLRYPQLRFEGTKAMGDGKFGLTAGLIRPVAGGDPTVVGAFVDEAGAGERSSQPFLQARAFYTKPVAGKPLTLGVSTHYGKESYKFGTTTVTRKKVDTWAVAGDFQVPAGSAVSFQGEIYAGSNVDSFQAGVNQGVNVDEPAQTVTVIDSVGGWVQFSLTPPQKKSMSFHVAYGVDNPDDGVLKAGQRSENSTLMASVFYKPTANFQTAVEYNLIKTKYAKGKENDASVLNLAFAFMF